jgi:predicted enzyme related to lactoylglutathione lyase
VVRNVIGMERTAPMTTRENAMTEGIKTIIYPVRDLAAAKALYGALLGVEPYADAPYYVGFKADGQDIGLDPNGHKQGMTGPVGYYHVSDIKESLQALLAAGAEPQQDVRDVGGGTLIATVKDADGNVIGLRQNA